MSCAAAIFVGTFDPQYRNTYEITYVDLILVDKKKNTNSNPTGVYVSPQVHRVQEV